MAILYWNYYTKKAGRKQVRISALSIAQLQDICDAVQDIFAYNPYSVL